MKSRLLIIIVGLIVVSSLTISDSFELEKSYGFGGLESLISEEHYEFIHFTYTKNIGQPIYFILEKIAYDNCNSFSAKIIDKDGNLVWGEGAEILCIPDKKSGLVTSYIKIGYNEDHPIIINES